MSNAIFADGLGYEGKVTLTLKSNDRVLTTKTYKNNGTAHLFKFLGLCLMDSYEEAKKWLPNKILLLSNDSDTDPSKADYAAGTQASEWRSFIQTPTIISNNSTSSSAAEVSVVYSFEIPKNAIFKPFNQVALYGAGVAETDISDFSAYYFLTNEFGRIAPLDTSLWSATTVLLIEWELTVSNKNMTIAAV